MLISYVVHQHAIEETYQMKRAASNGAGGTPGSVVGNPPQRGRLRLNVPRMPS